MIDQPPPPTASASQAAVVRDLLRRANYARGGIQDLLGASGDVLARPKERPVYLFRLASATGALPTLVKLFLLDEPVPAGEAQAALAPTPVAELQEMGLVAMLESPPADPHAVREEGDLPGRLVGLVRIVPHGNLWIASDHPAREGGHPDHVAGMHRPSVTLADLTIRRLVDTALDMGTGCGIQALLAARHVRHVVATDINERALAFAAFNMALNGVDNVEFRSGSFFEPVAGQRFDLIVTNPPYVVSPENAFLFRDSGLGRDRVSEQLVRQLPAFLEEGGFATIMVSWIHDGGDDVTAVPTTWLTGSGCDAWILHTALDSPLATAATWNFDLADDPERYGEAIERWTSYFRNEGIAALAYGTIILRRRTTTAGSQPNWIRTHDLSNDPRVEPADHLLRLFTGVDLVQDLRADADLSAQRITLTDGATVTRHVRAGRDRWHQAADLSLARGLPFTAQLDGFTAEMLIRLDGSRPLAEVLDAFARERDLPIGPVRASGLRIVRELLESGMAEVADGPDGDPGTSRTEVEG